MTLTISPKIQQARYAHQEGHTQVIYMSDGTSLITAGSDSLVRLFKPDGNERDRGAKDLENGRAHSDAVTCIDVYDGKIVTGSEDLSVKLFLSSEEPGRLLTRCSLHVRCVQFAPDGNSVAIGSDDNKITIVSISDTNRIKTLKHSHSVKSLSFHSSGDLLISSDCAGDIRVWDVSVEPINCVKLLSSIILPKEIDAPILARVEWSPNGKFFAVGGKSKNILLIERGSWNTFKTLEDAQSKDVSTLSFSPNALYLAVATLDCQIVIWDMKKAEVILRHRHEARATGLAWDPTRNTFAFVDCLGQLVFWDDIIPIEKGLAYPFSKKGTGLEDKDEIMSQVSEMEKGKRLATDNVDMDVESEGSQEDNTTIDFDDLDGFIVDDDGAGYVPKRKTKDDTSFSKSNQILDSVFSLSLKPFQPSSTPKIHDRRYLAFNIIGTIVTVQTPTYSTVSVDFHDKGAHRSFHFTDYYNFSMATLGIHGALFAVESSEGTAENGRNPSIVHFRPYESWAGKGDWRTQMPEGEDALCIGMNDQSCAVATSKGWLRIFGISGVQKGMFWCENGETMCLAGWGNMLMVITNGNSGVNKLNLGYTLYNTETMEKNQEGYLSLSPKSTLKWLGFSEEGLPLIYDSKGILSMLHRHRQPNKALWIPVLDITATAKEQGKSDSFWPIAVVKETLMGVWVKGVNGYPQFPRPVINEVAFRIPLIGVDNEVGILEESYIRANLFTTFQRIEAIEKDQYDNFLTESEKAVLEMDKVILKLIQFACKDDKTQRVLDLANQLQAPKPLDAAVQIALYYHLPALAERIGQIKDKLKTQKEKDASEAKKLSHLVDAPETATTFRKEFNRVTTENEEQDHMHLKVSPKRQFPEESEHIDIDTTCPTKKIKEVKEESNLNNRVRVNPFAAPKRGPTKKIPRPGSFFDAISSSDDKGVNHAKEVMGETSYKIEKIKKVHQSTLFGFAGKGPSKEQTFSVEKVEKTSMQSAAEQEKATSNIDEENGENVNDESMVIDETQKENVQIYNKVNTREDMVSMELQQKNPGGDGKLKLAAFAFDQKGDL